MLIGPEHKRLLHACSGTVGESCMHARPCAGYTAISAAQRLQSLHYRW